MKHYRFSVKHGGRYIFWMFLEGLRLSRGKVNEIETCFKEDNSS